MTLSLVSSAFRDGADIPSRYTCDDQDASPALSWTGVPADAKSLALIVDDPDAPDPAAPQRTWVHWVLYNLPPQSTGLPENVKPHDLPVGTKEGLNDWHRSGYGGPCPPIGQHRYFFKLYALNIELPEHPKLDKQHLEKAMQGHVVAQAHLIGLYPRS